MMKLRHNDPMKKAFTLTEVVIVIVIVTVIVTMIGSGFSTALNRQMLNSDVELVVSAIQRARTYTLASRAPGSVVSGFPTDGGRRYGVYFDTVANPDAYVIFYADNTQGYAGSREIERVPLTFSTFNPITITCAVCPPDENSIIFKRLVGDALTKKGASFPFLSSSAPYTTIRIQSNRSATLMRDIRIYPTGIIEVL
jgi:prepilin-type N-terminal cleavage/methylation domain-containing protein